jgi:hypothetical protein
MAHYLAELHLFDSRGELGITGRARLDGSTAEEAARAAEAQQDTLLGRYGAFLVRIVETTEEEWRAVRLDLASMATGVVDINLYR